MLLPRTAWEGREVFAWRPWGPLTDAGDQPTPTSHWL
jgi:hypothetical protein